MKSVANREARTASLARPLQLAVGSTNTRLADERGTRDVEIGFLRLAVAALLISGVYVTIVAIARTPLVELIAGRGYLNTALVAHVVFALDVWLVGFAAVLWVMMAARAGTPLPARPARAGLTLAWLGVILMAAVPFAGVGDVIMADYVPILLHPLFVLGLAAFFAGTAIVAVAFLVSTRSFRLHAPLALQALALGALAYLAALLSFALASLQWGVADFATVVWGGGHLLQMVNAAALVSIWLAMVGPTHPGGVSAIRASYAGFAVGIAVVLLVHTSAVRWGDIANIFWAGVGVPLVVAMIAVGVALLKKGKGERWFPRENTFLLYSWALLGIGGLIALTGMGNDIRVTAHYHASVGAVTTMFMGLTYRLLPQLGLPMVWPRLARTLPHLYGGGLVFLVGGLYWAGSAGTARKIFEAISTDPTLLPATIVFGIGALATVAGGVVYVLSAGASLLGQETREPALTAGTPDVLAVGHLPSTN
jgi:cytochrome c oxidase subunit I